MKMVICARVGLIDTSEIRKTNSSRAAGIWLTRAAGIRGLTGADIVHNVLATAASAVQCLLSQATVF